jgi:hypothetical protein
MQAGLAGRALTLREVFSSKLLFVASKNVIFLLFKSARPATFATRKAALAA